jgi:hypothetical protein
LFTTGRYGLWETRLTCIVGHVKKGWERLGGFARE